MNTTARRRPLSVRPDGYGSIGDRLDGSIARPHRARERRTGREKSSVGHRSVGQPVYTVGGWGGYTSRLSEASPIIAGRSTRARQYGGKFAGNVSIGVDAGGRPTGLSGRVYTENVVPSAGNVTATTSVRMVRGPRRFIASGSAVPIGWEGSVGYGLRGRPKGRKQQS